jgi:hypothetical protein
MDLWTKKFFCTSKLCFKLFFKTDLNKLLGRLCVEEGQGCGIPGVPQHVHARGLALLAANWVVGSESV